MTPMAQPQRKKSALAAHWVRKGAARAVFAGAALSMAGGGALAQQTGEAALEEAPQASAGSFSAEYSAGIEYDSNVAVLDIDASTTQGDFAALFDLGLDYEHAFGERSKVEIGYNFGQDMQFDVTQFSTQTHRGRAEVSHEFGGVTAGASYQLIYSRLDGAGFLRFHRFTPFLAGYAAGKKLYWRGSYIYTDKNFIDRIDRDGDVHAGSLEAFYFINGLKTYLIGGYRYEVEDTTAPEFDFESHNAPCPARRADPAPVETASRLSLREQEL